MSNEASMVVLGAGSYGTALAIILARNGHKILLWGHNPVHIQALEAARCNLLFLPGVPFPPTLRLEMSLTSALTASRNILIVVPSRVFGSLLMKLKPHLRNDARIVWATKGLEIKTGRLLGEVAREILGPYIPLAVISGPTFASELAAGLPTAIVLAATEVTFSNDLQQLLHSSNSVRVYNTSDYIGVQLSGVVKNIIAIGAGIVDGVGLGANARITLITRGLAEMSRIGKAIGADPATFMGMAGLGDLVLTCTDNQSRNRCFGILLGQGNCIQNALSTIGQIVEGYYNTKEVWALANRYKVEMPITEQLYQILYHGKDANKTALSLLERI